jgi:hypothetical protein
MMIANLSIHGSKPGQNINSIDNKPTKSHKRSWSTQESGNTGADDVPHITLRVVDLDQYRDEQIRQFQPTLNMNLPTIERYLRWVFAESSGCDHPIRPNDTIRFYQYGTPINDLTRPLGDLKIIHYRVWDPDRPFYPDFFYQWNDQNGQTQFRDLTAELLPGVQDGQTVGQLRSKAAEVLGISDPNRIAICSSKGVIAGKQDLVGNDWVVCHTAIWKQRCFHLKIEPEDSYITLHGMDREYILHAHVKDSAPVFRGPSSTCIQDWVEKRLLKRVSKDGFNRVNIGAVDVRLSTKYQTSGTLEGVPWGSTVNFTIPDSAAQQFLSEEGWLMPFPKQCAVCLEDSQVVPMASADCEHDRNTCKKCLVRWFETSLEGGIPWDCLRCPECPARMMPEDMRRLNAPELFER